MKLADHFAEIGDASERSARAPWGWVLILIAVTIALHSPGLSHPLMPMWDEQIHQTAARGTFASFFAPHLYVEPLHNPPWDHAVSGAIWLHKPTGPFWLAALLMHLVGPTPLALRLVSLAADMVAASALFLLGRRLLGRWFAFGTALTYLSLPFLWEMTQGYQFGDITDTTLAAANAVSMLLIVIAVEKGTVRWAALAGMAIGAAYLCKTALGLAPIGVAAGFVVLKRLRFSAGLTIPQFLAVAAGAVLVGAPWNIYCALKYPTVYKEEAAHTLSHLQDLPPNLAMWRRPADAIFNEINRFEFTPIPVAIILIAGMWLIVRALQSRATIAVALAMWLGASWIVLSIAPAKAPGLAWGVAPAVLIALGLTFRDAMTSVPLAAMLAGASLEPWVVHRWPSFENVRRLVPPFLPQTNQQAGLAEGLVLGAVGLLVGLLLNVVLRRFQDGGARRAAAVLSIGTLIAGSAAMAVTRRETVQARVELRYQSYTADVGTALDHSLPEKSVLDLAIEHDPSYEGLPLELMFWSGRMAYERMNSAMISRARTRGYHRYRVSNSAEPFAPVGDVPPWAWLRAYDLEQPARPAALPSDVVPLTAQVGPVTILGIAAGRIDGEGSRYAIYARSSDDTPELTVSFHLRDGRVVTSKTRDLLVGSNTLKDREWFIYPVLGPPHTEVKAVQIGTTPAISVAWGASP